MWQSIKALEKEGGRPKVKLYRGKSINLRIAGEGRNLIPAKSRKYILPKEATACDRLPLDPGSIFHRPGLRKQALQFYAVKLESEDSRRPSYSGGVCE